MLAPNDLLATRVDGKSWPSYGTLPDESLPVAVITITSPGAYVALSVASVIVRTAPPRVTSNVVVR